MTKMPALPGYRARNTYFIIDKHLDHHRQYFTNMTSTLFSLTFLIFKKQAISLISLKIISYFEQ